MSSPLYPQSSGITHSDITYDSAAPLMGQPDPDKAVGLGLLECDTSSLVASDSTLKAPYTSEWGYDNNHMSPSPSLKVEADEQWGFPATAGEHLRQPWPSSTSFPTPTDYTSASSLLSPATSRLTHSARTSISSLYDSHGLTSCESFDPMLTSQSHIAPHFAWSAPTGDDVIAYTGMHDISVLAPSPSTSVPDDYSAVFFSSHAPLTGLVPSTTAFGADHASEDVTVNSPPSSDNQDDESVMLVDRPIKKSTRKPTTKANAKFDCDNCGMLFQRSHNLKMHLRTHDRQRFKEHKCPYPECDKEFDRKADYVRHEDAVHLKMKRFRCQRCDARFPRKDTLQRHKADGCPKRHQLVHSLGVAARSEAKGGRRGSKTNTSSATMPPDPPVESPMNPLFQGSF